MWIKVMNNRDGDVGVLLLIMVVLLLVVLMVAVVELGMVVMRTAMMVVKVVVIVIVVVLVMLCRDVDGDVNDGVGSDGDNKGEVNCMVCRWR